MLSLPLWYSSLKWYGWIYRAHRINLVFVSLNQFNQEKGLWSITFTHTDRHGIAWEPILLPDSPFQWSHTWPPWGISLRLAKSTGYPQDAHSHHSARTQNLGIDGSSLGYLAGSLGSKDDPNSSQTKLRWGSSGFTGSTEAGSFPTSTVISPTRHWFLYCLCFLYPSTSFLQQLGCVY